MKWLEAREGSETKWELVSAIFEPDWSPGSTRKNLNGYQAFWKVVPGRSQKIFLQWIVGRQSTPVDWDSIPESAAQSADQNPKWSRVVVQKQNEPPSTLENFAFVFGFSKFSICQER